MGEKKRVSNSFFFCVAGWVERSCAHRRLPNHHHVWINADNFCLRRGARRGIRESLSNVCGVWQNRIFQVSANLPSSNIYSKMNEMDASHWTTFWILYSCSFSVDPYARMSTWSSVSNVTLMWVFILGGTQASFQRYASMRNLERAQRWFLRFN